MRKIIFIIMIWLISVLCLSADFSVKLKDFVRFGSDNRDNQIMGYGIVGGLDGTGDKNSLAVNSAINFLSNFGIVTNEDEFTTKNIAAVVVTATLPAFARTGDKIDVTVSSIGDAKNLQGGILYQTPLVGADRNVYAVAAGNVSIGGFNAGLGGAGAQRNHVTAARIPNGALVEQEVPVDFIEDNRISLVLKNKDFANAEKVKKAVDLKYGRGRAKAKDAGLVEVEIPYSFRDNPIAFIAQLEQVEIVPQAQAKVIINEKTGSVVISDGVRIAPTAVAHGDLTIEIEGREEGGSVVPLMDGGTLRDIVRTLNEIGTKPRDLIAILQMLKESGALHGELEII